MWPRKLQFESVGDGRTRRERKLPKNGNEFPKIKGRPLLEAALAQETVPAARCAQSIEKMLRLLRS